MNVDPLNPDNAPAIAELLSGRVRWVRLVSRNDAVLLAYVEACMAADIMVLAIITEQSAGFWCPADAYQIGNEPDMGPVDAPYVPGSDQMGAAAYVGYWRLYFNTLRDQGVMQPIIGAGLGSGQTNYWQAVQLAGGLVGAAGFAVHPYAKTAAQAKRLLMAYQYITPNLPLWVTEWNRSAAEIPLFAQMLRQYSVMSAWFCWSPSVAASRNIYVLDDTARRTLAAVA